MEQKIATSIEQSKKLLELGLSPNTADLLYDIYINSITNEQEGMSLDFVSNWQSAWGNNKDKSDLFDDRTIPCWSLSALLDLMPKDRFIDIELSYGGFSVDPLEYVEKWFISFENEKDYELDIKTFSSEHPIDAVFEMVCWLLENGFIKKDVSNGI